MKRLLSILMVMLTVGSYAAGHSHRVPHRHPHWKTITATGVAAGTAVAAYNISDGIGEGIKIAAEKEPATVNGWLDRLTAPARFLLWAASLLGVAWLVRFMLPYIRRCRKEKSP